jgi:hypothetical protein
MVTINNNIKNVVVFETDHKTYRYEKPEKWNDEHIVILQTNDNGQLTLENTGVVVNEGDIVAVANPTAKFAHRKAMVGLHRSKYGEYDCQTNFFPIRMEKIEHQRKHGWIDYLKRTNRYFALVEPLDKETTCVYPRYGSELLVDKFRIVKIVKE